MIYYILINIIFILFFQEINCQEPLEWEDKLMIFQEFGKNKDYKFLVYVELNKQDIYFVLSKLDTKQQIQSYISTLQRTVDLTGSAEILNSYYKK